MAMPISMENYEREKVSYVSSLLKRHKSNGKDVTAMKPYVNEDHYDKSGNDEACDEALAQLEAMAHELGSICL